MAKIGLRMVQNYVKDYQVLVLEWEGVNPDSVWNITRDLIRKAWKIEVPAKADRTVHVIKDGFGIITISWKL